MQLEKAGRTATTPLHVAISRAIDDAITERVLTAVMPLTIKLALDALANLEQRDKPVSAQWRWRIERARYEAEFAERRYEEVDPSNRLIASTLEKRWNDAMQRMAYLEAELAARRDPLSRHFRCYP